MVISNAMEETRVRPHDIIFRALRHRNYRLYFAGQNLSLIGTWMQNVAIGWFIYRITDSAAILGLVSFAVQVPSFILTPVFGVFADRWNKYRVVKICQFLAMIQAASLAVLIMTGAVKVWHIAALGAVLGIINALEIPTRHAFLVDMIESKEDLSNAIALNSLMFNAARLVGPPIAGFVINAWGEGICFLVNALSYIAVIVALDMMRLKFGAGRNSRGHPFQEMKEGVEYTFGSAPRRSIIILVGLMSLIAMSQSVLMPVFARDVLGGGAHTFGILAGAVGLGALSGAVYLASKKDPVKLLKFIPSAAAVFGAALVLFSFSRNLWISVALLFLAGMGLMSHMVVSNTILQTITEDSKRGRVMSFYTMGFMGMATFGSLIGGAVAARIGAPYTVLFGGVFCLCAGFMFSRQMPYLKAQVRRHCREVPAGEGGVCV